MCHAQGAERDEGRIPIQLICSYAPIPACVQSVCRRVFAALDCYPGRYPDRQCCQVRKLSILNLFCFW